MQDIFESKSYNSCPNTTPDPAKPAAHQDHAALGQQPSHLPGKLEINTGRPLARPDHRDVTAHLPR